MGNAEGQTMPPLGGRRVHSVCSEGSGALMPWPVSFPLGEWAPPPSTGPEQPGKAGPASAPLGHGFPLCWPRGRHRTGMGHSLVWEELQGSAACRDLAQSVAPALAEASCGGRLVMNVHGGVGPLGWRGAGRGAEEAAEAASRGAGGE